MLMFQFDHCVMCLSIYILATTKRDASEGNAILVGLELYRPGMAKSMRPNVMSTMTVSFLFFEVSANHEKSVAKNINISKS